MSCPHLRCLAECQSCGDIYPWTHAMQTTLARHAHMLNRAEGRQPLTLCTNNTHPYTHTHTLLVPSGQTQMPCLHATRFGTPLPLLWCDTKSSLPPCCSLQQQDQAQTHEHCRNKAAAAADGGWAHGSCSRRPVACQGGPHWQGGCVVPEDWLGGWWGWGRGRKLHVLAPTPASEKDAIGHHLTTHVCQHHLKCVVGIVPHCQVERGLAVQLQARSTREHTCRHRHVSHAKTSATSATSSTAHTRRLHPGHTTAAAGAAGALAVSVLARRLLRACLLSCHGSVV